MLLEMTRNVRIHQENHCRLNVVNLIVLIAVFSCNHLVLLITLDLILDLRPYSVFIQSVRSWGFEMPMQHEHALIGAVQTDNALWYHQSSRLSVSES